MNNKQLDLFSQMEFENPLKERYVCLSGDFRIPSKVLDDKLMAIGAKGKKKKKEEAAKNNKEVYRFHPTKYIHFFIIGNNASEDALKRIALNEHDGFYTRVINEDKLYDFLEGRYSEEDFVPEKVEKLLHLDISYYNWIAPIINGENFVSRVSSPLKYIYDSYDNPISQKEIFVPIVNDINKDLLYQLIGNLGGYANKIFYEDTSLIMLSDDTLDKLKQGIKDDVIRNIEDTYNKSNAVMFNYQFTCESDFINWVKQRIKLYPDDSTITLLNKYEQNKQQRVNTLIMNK